MAKEHTKPVEAKGDVLMDIPLDRIIPTPDNRRVIDEEAESFIELKNSIAANGLRIPVQVRPHPDKPGHFDLRYGARRYRACQLLKLPTIRALVRDGQTDEDAKLSTFEENFAREGLKAIEEGAIVAELLESMGGDVNAVAAKLGRKYTWIAQRARIHTGLAPEWRKAATNPGSPIAAWSARALALVARLPAGSQLAVLKALSQRYNFENLRLHDVEVAVQEIVRPIGKQPWSEADSDLHAKAGACDKCIKRSDVQPDLWEDDLAPGKKRPLARCLDPDCWKEKSARFIELKIAALRKAGGNFVLVEDADSRLWGDEAKETAKRFGRFLSGHQYYRVKPNAASAVKALVIAGADAGKEIWIRHCRESGGGSREPKEQLTLAEKRKQLESRRWAQTINRLAAEVRKRDVGALVDAKGKPLSAEDRATLTMILAARLGIDWQAMPPDRARAGVGPPTIGKGKGALAFAAATATLWNCVRRMLSAHIRYIGSTMAVPEHEIREARAVAGLFGIDVDALFKTVSGEKGFTEPKSWTAKAKTPKASKAKKSAACKKHCKAIMTAAQCKDCRFAKSGKGRGAGK